MTLAEELTPTTYELVRIGLQQEGTNVVAIADIKIRNAAGRVLKMHNPETILLPGEKAALVTFVNRELAAFGAATGLTKWVKPEEEV